MRDTRAAAVIILAVTFTVFAAGCASTASGGQRRPGAGLSGMARNRPSSGATPAHPATLSPVAKQCGPPDAPGYLRTVRAADGARLEAAETGAGQRGVVLVPQLGGAGMCGWWDYAAYLAANGYHVVAFNHRCTGGSACPSGPAGGDLMSDIRGAVTWLRQHGATQLALVGASQGASEVLIAATAPPRGVRGIVALSADELTLPLASPPYPSTAMAAASRVRLPALFAVATLDPNVSVGETRRLVAVTGSREKRLVVLGADAGHGWALVSPTLPGGPRPRFSQTVLQFLRDITS